MARLQREEAPGNDGNGLSVDLKVQITLDLVLPQGQGHSRTPILHGTSFGNVPLTACLVSLATGLTQPVGTETTKLRMLVVVLRVALTPRRTGRRRGRQHRATPGPKSQWPLCRWVACLVSGTSELHDRVKEKKTSMCSWGSVLGCNMRQLHDI